MTEQELSDYIVTAFSDDKIAQWHTEQIMALAENFQDMMKEIEPDA